MSTMSVQNFNLCFRKLPKMGILVIFWYQKITLVHKFCKNESFSGKGLYSKVEDGYLEHNISNFGPNLIKHLQEIEYDGLK
jgi:hypothetical protein